MRGRVCVNSGGPTMEAAMHQITDLILGTLVMLAITVLLVMAVFWAISFFLGIAWAAINYWPFSLLLAVVIMIAVFDANLEDDINHMGRRMRLWITRR